MGKGLFLMLVIVVFAGCSAIPVKSSTPMANYNKLIVRSINWNETAISDMNADDVKEYIASQHRLAELFQEIFERYAKETGFFEAISYGDVQADAETLILEPKIYTLKPSGYMPGASYTGLLKTKDGKQVGKYTAERRVSGTNAMNTIEKLVKELAEDAGSKLPYAQ